MTTILPNKGVETLLKGNPMEDNQVEENLDNQNYDEVIHAIRDSGLLPSAVTPSHTSSQVEDTFNHYVIQRGLEALELESIADRIYNQEIPEEMAVSIGTSLSGSPYSVDSLEEPIKDVHDRLSGAGQVTETEAQRVKAAAYVAEFAVRAEQSDQAYGKMLDGFMDTAPETEGVKKTVDQRVEDATKKYDWIE